MECAPREVYPNFREISVPYDLRIFGCMVNFLIVRKLSKEISVLFAPALKVSSFLVELKVPEIVQFSGNSEKNAVTFTTGNFPKIFASNGMSPWTPYWVSCDIFPNQCIFLIRFISETKSVTPIFTCISDTVPHYLAAVKVWKKKSPHYKILTNFMQNWIKLKAFRQSSFTSRGLRSVQDWVMTNDDFHCQFRNRVFIPSFLCPIFFKITIRNRIGESLLKSVLTLCLISIRFYAKKISSVRTK